MNFEETPMMNDNGTSPGPPTNSGTCCCSASSSSSSSVVKTMTLDDLIDIDPSKMERPLNILVTIHDIKPFLGGVYVHGLGLWVNYIVSKYLVDRKIPHKLHTKSILTSGHQKTSPKNFIEYINRHKIDIVIPSDVTDTMFLSEHYQQLSEHVKFAVTADVEVYKMLEDKWHTYNMCKDLDITTPLTKVFDRSSTVGQEYPFFLKIASGTNAGRGVWHIEDEEDLREALKAREITRRQDTLLIQQAPVSGDIITAQIIFDTGNPIGFFFCQSVQSENLAGMGDNWINSQSDGIRDMVSDVKVELNDSQWEELHEIFVKIGHETAYHGMMDIEFIVDPTGGIHLLECNPRFSGGLHTTLSNPGFLDLYFDTVLKTYHHNNNSKSGEKKSSVDGVVCGNYSVSVDLNARLGDFDPTGFYLKHPLNVLSLRHWFTDSHISYYHDAFPNASKYRFLKVALDNI